MRNTTLLIGILAIAIMPTNIIHGKEIPVKQGDSKLIITENSYSTLGFEMSITQFEARTTKSPDGIFTELVLDGAQYSLDIGSPRLPWINRLIEIPYGCEPTVEILLSAYQDVSLTQEGYSQLIYPAQGPQIKTDARHPFHYNASAYQHQGFLSQDLVSIEYVGEMRGVRIARVKISPFWYDPSQNLVRVFHTLKVNIQFADGDLEQTLLNKEKYYSPYFESAHRLLWNYKAMDASGGGTEDINTSYPVKYVIVADSSFRQTLQPFVSWKRRKGFIVIEAYKQNPGVGSTTASIKAYLQGLYNNATPGNPAPSFILLVGDVAQLPAFTASSHVTDRGYCEYTNDALPEVYYGRFSATNAQQLQVQINKTLQYEQYLMQDPGFLNSVVIIAGADGTFGPTHANGQINYGTNTYFNLAHGLNTEAYLYPASSSNASLIRQQIGSGVAFANYTAHGSSSGWADPSFSTSHVPAMNNPGRYPLMVGNACLTNKFDSPECFGEALLRADGKGAIGYIGASDNTYWDEDFYWAVGVGTITANPTFSGSTAGMYDRWVHDHGEAFQEWFFTQAQMMFAGNLAVTQAASSVNYYWEIYHLMGDPSLMPYLGVPEAMQVSYTPLIPLGVTQFVVNAAPYSYVALTRNDTLYGAALADSNGTASLTILPFTNPGSAEVVVTAQNYQPFIGTVLAASPTGPYLDISGISILDTAGNSNGLADYGELVILDLNIENLTNFTANSVSLKLSTSDTTKLSLLDTTYAMPLVQGLSTNSTSGAFALKIKDFIPDGYQVPFVVTMSDNNNGLWTSTFNLTLNAPVIRIIDLAIDDSQGGNGNGRLDAGENVNIRFVVSNLGHADAGKTGLSLYSSDNRVTLSSNGLNINTFAAGDTAVALIPASVYSLAPHGTVVTFSANAVFLQYADQKLIYRMVGRIDEDFETGDLNKFSWIQGGNQGWVIDQSEVYEGAYSARSASIQDQQNSTLSITMNVIADDTIWFHRKVSSEQYYDYMEFYVDGTLKGQWSGNMGWAQEKFPVEAGLREFKWVYFKDYYLASGQDRAWVDYILFPPNDLWASVGESVEENSLLEVFPNPNAGQFTVRFQSSQAKTAQWFLFDVAGRVVLSGEHQPSPGTASLDFNLGDLKQGIYYMSITDGLVARTASIVITRNR